MFRRFLDHKWYIDLAIIQIEIYNLNIVIDELFFFFLFRLFRLHERMFQTFTGREPFRRLNFQHLFEKLNT